MPPSKKFDLLLSMLLLAATTLATAAPIVTPALYADLRWRMIGPFRGGWATAVAGIPDRPDSFCIGTAGGGVWKTTNAGRTWTSLTDSVPVAAIGALAIASSDANVIYIGTGQSEPRYDSAAGDGVYRSGDGGSSWQHVGLEATQHIGAIHVDPRDANIVTVAALGHLFGPNPERGLYRSTDGGANWQHVLAIDDDTGVVDIAADPSNPDLLYAATWQERAWPWRSSFTSLTGSGSAIYQSTDGGATWTRVGGDGWPRSALGRIDLAVAHTDAGVRLYASVDSDSDGGIWRSDDSGGHWRRVNDDNGVFSDRYFGRLVVAPDNADVVYAMGQSIRRSTDGGVTWSVIRGAPGGDGFDALWINPLHSERWIAASDRGASVSVDGGKTWSSGYNQPTGQFYRLAVDDRFPYWIYSGQQDAGSLRIASRSDYGAIGPRDWQPVGGGERGAVIPDPIDSNVVYGSGPGGRVSRWDARSGQVVNIAPWPLSSHGRQPTAVKYRYGWIAPLAISPTATHALYLGAQQLFRSTDRGSSWQIISPDLTGEGSRFASTARGESERPTMDGRTEVPTPRDVAPGMAASDPDSKACANSVTIANAKACGYGVISSIAPAPGDVNEIWIGTDDGLIQLSRDGGAHWTDITPKSLPTWAAVSSIELSTLDAGTAYVAIDNQRQDDLQPRLLRTHDWGRSWQDASSGLPANHIVSVVRCDPLRRGLLYAGTDNGVQVSFDDGAHWQSLQQNLPTAWVRDLLVHGDDLIAATQGRALWVMDNLTPLRQLVPSLAARPMFLFPPVTATRLHANNNRDAPSPPEEPLGTNPPAGAVIDYWIGSKSAGAVTLEILDSERRRVRRFSSDDAPETLVNAERSFAPGWLRPSPPLATTPGMHRFVWDLRYPRPKAIRYEYGNVVVWGADAPAQPQGAYAPPGRYEIVLRAADRETRALLIVKPDPRSPLIDADYATTFDFSQNLSAMLAQVWRGYAETQAVHAQLQALVQKLEDDANAQSLRDAIAALDLQLWPLADDTQRDDAPDWVMIGNALAALATDAEAADVPPTVAQQQLATSYGERLKQTAARWQSLRGGDLLRLNDSLRAADLTPVEIPAAGQLRIRAEKGGGDLP